MRYTLGDDGYYKGAVLKRDESAVIRSVLMRPGGEWLAYDAGQGLLQFPLWNYFPGGKKSLAELTEKEFAELALNNRLRFLPLLDLAECFGVLKGVYRNAGKTGN